jgi:hypothetical protein
MLSSERYQFLDQDGQDHLPSESELKAVRADGKIPIAILDAMVCMNIVSLVDGKVLKEPQLQRTQNLLTYFKIHDRSIDVLGSFGLMELCTNKKSLEINKTKFYEMGGKLFYALSLDPQSVIDRNFKIGGSFPVSENEIERYDSVKPLLTLSYCNLLKIREIAKKHRTEALAEKAIQEYYDWMDTQVDCIAQIELQLALLIIGGNACQPMIALDNPNSAKDKIVHTILGTVWDLFHHRIIGTYSNSMVINGMAHKTLFVTEDKNLSILWNGIKLEQVIMENNHITNSLHSSERRYKNINENFLRQLESRGIQRRLSQMFQTRGDRSDLNFIEQEIIKLEDCIV